MIGLVISVNHAENRLTVETDEADFCVVAALGDTQTEEGDVLDGPFNEPGESVIENLVKRESFDAAIEAVCLSREEALPSAASVPRPPKS